MFNPLKWLAENTIGKLFTNILLFIDSIIYSLINWLYQIILAICNINIFENSYEIDALIGRIYIILGVVVLFLVAYSLLKSMINPDEALKGKKSPVNTIKDVIISIVLIALIPTIFDFAYGFQNALLTRNTIGNIILGTSNAATGSSEDLLEEGGMAISANILHAFLHENYSKCSKEEISNEFPQGYDCSSITIETGEGMFFRENLSFSQFWTQMYEQRNLLAITDLADKIVNGEVTYYYIISTLAGVFVLLVFISYCFDIALRVIKLAVYELIAPLPILCRIMPNDQANKTFGNWMKATISTYLEVFIRLAILFFAILIIKIVTQNFSSVIMPLFSGGASLTVALFAEMFIIVGIILFVRQAPNIIKEITGLDGGKYNVLGSAMKTAAMLGGGVTAAVGNFTDKTDENGQEKSMFNRFRSAAGGLGSGMFRSTWGRDDVKDFKSLRANASKSAENAIKAHNQRIARNARYAQPGEGRFNDLKTAIKVWSGASQSREILEAKKKMYDEAASFQKELFDLAADDGQVIALEGQKKAASEKIIDRDTIRRDLIEARRRELRAQVPEASDQFIEDQINQEMGTIDRRVDAEMSRQREEQAR